MFNRVNTLKRLLLVFITLAVICGTFLLLSACVSNKPPGNAVTVRLATLPMETSALLFISEDQGFFKQNALDVEFRYYDTGLGALNGVLAGEADIAAPVGEYAMVGKVLGKEEIKTIGAIDKVDYQALLVRKDRVIEDVPDLRGKKLGVILKTQEEFYLTRFLEMNGIRVADVTFVHVPLARSVDTIVNGDVDAMVMVPPYTDDALDRLNGNAVLWPIQANQLTQQMMVCTSDWINRNQKIAESFLESLAEAQDYLVNNPDRIKTLMKKRLGVSEEDVTRIWSQNQYGLSLDQSLITAMEAEARWMMANGLTGEKTVPDFLGFIYQDALKTIKPEAVNIIR